MALGDNSPAQRLRRVPVRPLASGLHDNTNHVLLKDGESPDVQNADFDRDTVAHAGGSTKFGNQTAPRPGLLTGVPSASALLAVQPSKSVPIRGSACLPYSERQDGIGADYLIDVKTGGGATAPHDRSFARQRGKSFDLQLSFRVPESEKLFSEDVRGALTNVAPLSTWDMKFGFDQALDEFFAVIQKGGDRAPMSWALGVVNTGKLFDIDVGGGLNIFGISTATYAKRRSNYCLCFMWLDVPMWGVDRPVCARYRLTNGSVFMDEANANGAYPSFAYRAMIVPVFVEQGASYHVALRLALDTGSAGTAFVAATGETSGVAWQGDGSVEWKVARDFDAVETFTSANGAGTQILRYKGPSDSLEYLCKYGVRYHGRDPVHLGLGYRFTPWAGGGFVPFGIDSAPVENGGFSLTDLSVHSLPASIYGDYDNPEEEPSSLNTKTLLYDLRIEYDPAVDATGTRFGISEIGMVRRNGGFAGHTWGNETTRWANIGSQGKSPWGPYNSPWAGLGGLLTTGFNPEALKGYRLVFAQDNGGFAAAGACGGMISIGSFVPTAFGAYTFTQHIVAEGGDQFLNAVNPTLAIVAGRWMVLIRAFRWNQRQVVVDDVRLYSRPRTWSELADFSLRHELDLTRTQDPGLDTLLAAWPCADGDGAELEELIHGNAGFFTPLAAPVMKSGGVALSGEGEALHLNLAENPDFREQLRAAQADRRSGIAIQISMVMPEAQYGIAQRVNNQNGAGGASSLWRSKFTSVIAAWDFANPDRHSDVLFPTGATVATNEIDHVGGYYSRPQPRLEFGHNVYVENGVGVEPFAYPMGFSMRVPSTGGGDQRAGQLAVPGAGATGMHAWFVSGTNQSRWDKLAGWVGREIVVQFGLEPGASVGEFIPYIAAWPKEFLNPQTNDPSGAEFAYFATAAAVRLEQAERSVIVIGGAWNPRIADFRDSGVWATLARSAHETNARMIVKRVRVFGASAPGNLPSANGGITPSGTGKLIGGNALPLGPISAEDLLQPVASGGTPVDFTAGSSTVRASGASLFSPLLPAKSRFAVLRTFLEIIGDTVRLPVVDSDGAEWQRTYWIGAVGSQTITLNRPVVGATRKASAASSFRVVGATDFADEVVPPLTVGGGNGYDLATVTTKDAHISAPFFENLAPPGMPWRFRIYSSIPAGIGRSLLPRWVRGVICSTWNKITGLHGMGEKLFAGTQGSLFEADDRWRQVGPTSALPKSFAFRARRQGDLVLPLESDRVVFHSTTLTALPTWLVDAGVAYFGFLDAWVRVNDLRGIQTIAWSGRMDSDPAKVAGTHGIQFWMRLVDGTPELVIGSSDTSSAAVPSRGLFVARGARQIARGEWVHIRWALSGVLGSPNSASVPTLWIGGKRVAIVRSATGDAALAGSWLSLATIQWESSYKLVLGAARDCYQEPTPTSLFTVATDAHLVPILPSDVRGFVHALDGEISGVVFGRASGASGFNSTSDFDPLAVNYATAGVTRRFAALETSQGHYGVGHKMYDAAGAQWGVIHSHPAISITHEMGGGDEPWSFAETASELFCANGGRVGIVDSIDNAFRFAGIRAPLSVPRVAIVRQPLWKQNYFIDGGDPLNDPIFDLQADRTAPPPTSRTVAVKQYVRHWNNPGTKVLRQDEDAAMDWQVDMFFAFKCLLRMRSVSGRISIYSRRGSLKSGGPFLEIRDGFLVFGWYDTDLKEECTITTSEPVIKPGKTYYIYVRKWYPRGGLNTGHNALYTADNSNWSNSVHVGNSGTRQQCYDSLIWREVPTAAQTAFNDFTGYDCKTYVRDTDATAGWGGGANYAYSANGSSARLCVSATAADSRMTTDPYLQRWSGTGFVIFNAAILNTAFMGDATGRIQLAAGAGPRFVADHVGMLLQISNSVAGAGLDGQIFRITQFISATTVRCIQLDGTAAPFNTLDPVAETLSVFMGVSLVKSSNFDFSRSPDPGLYPIEVFGSSLQANPLNGVSPFDGEAWSVAWDVVPGEAGGGAGEVADGGGNLVTLPNIFESATGANVPNPPAAGTSIMSCACEVGTDVLGLQGTGNANPAGGLPWQGIPLGELQVDNTFAHTCIDTAQYFDKLTPYAASATAPSSTQPNAALQAALDGAAQSVDPPVWADLAPVIAGTRVARILFYDRRYDVLSAPGEQFTISIPDEDEFNPSSSVRLVLLDLPPCPDRRRVSTRIYFSDAASQVLKLRAQIDDDQPNSAALPVDEINAPALALLDTTFLGVPPNAKLVASSQDRMWYGNLEGDEDAVGASLAFFHEIVPVSNIFPVNTGKSAITAMREFNGALVVFKRDCLIPYKVINSLPTEQKIVWGEGCESNASIATLEGRLYFVSDRGPCVLIGAWEPFFLGRPTQQYFSSSLDLTALPRISGALNRRRNQYVFTVQSLGRAKMDRRFSLEFKHPSAGEDIERAEMAGGHRVSFYAGPSCTALGSVLPRGGGKSLLVGGTDHGFIVWLDRADARTELGGPLVEAAGVPLWGDRTFAKGVAALTGDIDTELEGPMGMPLRAYNAGELERYVLCAAGGKLFLEAPFEDAFAWLTSVGIATGAIVSLGGMLMRFSTKAFDGDTPDLAKQFFFLNVTRRVSSGTVYVDLFKDLATVPIGTEALSLTEAFFTLRVQEALQQTRAARFLFRTQTPDVDLDLELADLVLALQETDPR